MRLALLLALAAFASGCASPPKPAATSADPAPTEFASVSIVNAVVTSVNGKRASFWSGYGDSLRLGTGDHTLTMSCRHELVTRSINLLGYFQAGRSYRVTCHYQGEARFAADLEDLGKTAAGAP